MAKAFEHLPVALMSGLRLLCLAGFPLLAQTNPDQLSLLEVRPGAFSSSLPAPPRITRASPVRRLDKSLWYASLAAVALANVADATSSWQKQEANRVLSNSEGRFGGKAVAIKCGINGLWVAGQIGFARKTRSYRALTVLNLAAASVMGAFAYRNQSLPSR